MLSNEDEEQIEHALWVETKTVVEGHFQQYMKILKDDYDKLVVIAELTNSFHAYVPEKSGGCVICNSLKSWKQSSGGKDDSG